MASTIVLITGTNSGVGYAAATVIARASPSYHVILTGRSSEKVKSALSNIKNSGVKGSLSAMHLDVTDDSSIEQAAQKVKEQFGRLDVLINNAGVGSRDPDLRARFKACFEVNTIGPAVVSEAFRPLLLKSNNPYSIFVSSGAGSLEKATTTPKAFDFEEAYRMSKAALNMLAIRELLEYGPQGLKVFAMCPGFVISNLRGLEEEMRTGWGKAGDPEVSGQLLLSIMQGDRDSDMGKLVAKDGVYPW